MAIAEERPIGFGRMKRKEDPRFIRGQGNYVDDVVRPGMLHGAVLRAAHAVGPVVESGAVLATCSDEFNGEIRSAFDRNVARALSAPNVPGGRRIFSVSNLGGRIEPGAIALADLHFTALSRERGAKLLLLEIASHVGRRHQARNGRTSVLMRPPARIAACRPAGGATSPNLALTAASKPCCCANHMPRAGSCFACSNASRNVGSLLSAPFGRWPCRMNFASSLFMKVSSPPGF